MNTIEIETKPVCNEYTVGDILQFCLRLLE
jgi:hypothetical protein